LGEKWIHWFSRGQREQSGSLMPQRSLTGNA
jgi:hypothetical protein